MFTQDQVWASAFVAYEQNKGFYNRMRSIIESSDEKPIKSNVRLMMEMLKDDNDAFADAVESGQEVRNYLRKAFTMRSLQTTLSDFERSEVTAVNAEEFPVDGLALSGPARLVGLYRELKEYEDLEVTENCMGKVGTRSEFNLRVTVSNYSNKYDTFIIKGVADEKYPVMFFFKKPLACGLTFKFKGTVKRYMQDLVQLNRVTLLNGDTK